MNDKLELYREIVEIDPSSRVFFLYAQLLEKEGKIDETLNVLALGLEKQPDYLEARLYYIDLLAKHDKIESAQIQLHKFTDILKKYPGFWSVWSRLTAEENSTISSTLALLSAFFTNPSLTLMEVIQAGLQHYNSSTIPFGNASFLTNTPADKNDDKKDEASKVIETTHDFTEDEAELKANIENIVHLQDAPFSANALAEPQEIFEEKTFTEESFSIDDFKKEEEVTSNQEIIAEVRVSSAKTSTHTRSMADLLATQGDVEGAIAIYSELLENADESQIESLKQRIIELEAQQNSLGDNSSEGQNNFKAIESQSRTKNSKGLSPKMQSMLEQLATRLEKRATI